MEFKTQESSKKIHLNYKIKNYDRSVGAKVSGYLASNYGLNEGKDSIQLKIHFRGIAGQSFGVWNHNGVELNLQGDANDYVGKGMSGGQISIYPADNIQYIPSRSAIIGNTCLYGATGGKLFAAGQAGERFAVRNSGAVTVIEGVGDHACEYMTGGTVVILGPVGENFGAGMTGGKAFVFDDFELLEQKANLETVKIISLTDNVNEVYEQELRQLLIEHIEKTNSRWAQKVMNNFDNYVDGFKVVVPKVINKNSTIEPLQLLSSSTKVGGS